MADIELYQDAFDQKYGQPFEVPILPATEENIKGYGNIVTSFEKEEVAITTWPAQGHRPIHPGTGNCGGFRESEFIVSWEGRYCNAVDTAFPDGDFTTGVLPEGNDQRTHVLVREVNYHPDGGQVFFTKDHAPFVGLLALPGDDIKLNDLKAFYFDGSFGIQIHANVWHQSMYPINDKTVFLNKQGAIFACVVCDFPTEFGRWVSVPLKPNFK